MNPEYEYHTDKDSWSGFEATLEIMAAKGWRLVTMFPANGYVYYALERQKK